MGLFNDLQIGATEAALDAIAQRQRVISNNIANAATPGFRASRLDFEAELRDAVSDGEPHTAGIAVRDSGGAARFDGNNVSLEEETSDLIRSNLHYESLVESLSYKLRLIRTAIGR